MVRSDIRLTPKTSAARKTKRGRGGDPGPDPVRSHEGATEGRGREPEESRGTRGGTIGRETREGATRNATTQGDWVCCVRAQRSHRPAPGGPSLLKTLWVPPSTGGAAATNLVLYSSCACAPGDGGASLIISRMRRPGIPVLLQQSWSRVQALFCCRARSPIACVAAVRLLFRLGRPWLLP
jgi:hypothetical protein